MAILENLRSNLWMMGARKKLKKVRIFQKEFENMTLEELSGVFRRWKESNYVTPQNMHKKLPEIFGATVVLSKRTLFLSPFDVQILAGIAISEQNFPEMKTGEGKTLVTLLPGVLCYLAGIKTHIMTSNPYLAERDAGKMSPPYEAIGAKVAFIKQKMDLAARKKAYDADVTYGQGHQFAFDFLNSYLVDSLEQQTINLERLNRTWGIIDEGDHVIIRGSRTPMIISGPKDKLDERYEKIQPFVARLLPEDYDHDKQMQTAHLRLSGWNKLEEQLAMNGLLSGSLADFKNKSIHHVVRNLVNANFAQQEGVHYIVIGGDVKLIDTGTGRIADGRRYSDGLHTAIEAVQMHRGVKIKPDNRITARINFAMFLKLYKYISAMSGTMKEDRDEFSELFPAHCLMIPTNRPVIRVDHPTLLFNKRMDGVRHVIKMIQEKHKKGQPILVCCSSVRDSEFLSMEIHRVGIAHKLLNARQGAHEAEIVAEAGQLGAVTIGTGMVSRGTDIYLGKNFQLQRKKRSQELSRPLTAEEQGELKTICDQERAAVMDAGGLFVLIFTLPSAKKIIRQFRGRAGRQGEPGESALIITLEDPMLFPLTKDQINKTAMEVYFPTSKEVHSGAQVDNICEEVLGAHAEHHYNSREHAGKYADNDIMQLIATYRIRDYILRNKKIEYFRKFLVSNPDQPKEELNKINKILEKPENLRKLSKKLLKVFDYEWSELLIQRDALMKTSSVGNFAQKNPLDVYKEEAKSLFDTFLEQTKQKFSAWLPAFAEEPEIGGIFDFSRLNFENMQLDKLAKNILSKNPDGNNMSKMFGGLFESLMATSSPQSVKKANQKVNAREKLTIFSEPEEKIIKPNVSVGVKTEKSTKAKVRKQIETKKQAQPAEKRKPTKLMDKKIIQKKTRSSSNSGTKIAKRRVISVDKPKVKVKGRAKSIKPKTTGKKLIKVSKKTRNKTTKPIKKTAKKVVKKIKTTEKAVKKPEKN
jgi:preprotein translocase subunit SecA